MSTLELLPIKVYPLSFQPSTFSARAEPNEPADDNSDNKKLTFRCTELLKIGETSVYRGVLEGYGSQEINAICKLAINPRRDLQDCFDNEARAYQKDLRDMQGHYIPICYGVFDGIVNRDRAVCIIMEDCGHRIGRFSNLADEWRVRAVEILMAIHKRGLQHNDFGPENVVVDDFANPSYIKIIDFGHCSPHKCERQLDLAAYQFAPDWSQFGCPELYNAAETSCVWTPTHIKTLGGFVDIYSFESAEDLVELEPRYKTKTSTYEDAIRRAKADIQGWQDRWIRRRDYIDGDAYLALRPAM